MPLWKPPYKTRRANRILSFAVKQNNTLLEIAGEACFLLKRQARLNTTFQLASREVSTLTETASSHSYSIDPDTGMLRYCLWSASTDAVSTYPDIGVTTVTVQASGGTSVWEPAVDKYSFIADREEHAFDIYQDQLNSDGTAITDAVYVVFNTPPFTADNSVYFTFGNINPLTNFNAMQPMRDNQEGYQRSLFGFEQWLNPFPKIRKKFAPNSFLLAFPGIKSDFTITESGLLRETRGDFWTVPPPYSPAIVEHDVVVRELTSQRFQVVDFTPIYIENILVSQHFDMVELDPRSSIYNVEYDTGS
jgi:hypothetical protein